MRFYTKLLFVFILIFVSFQTFAKMTITFIDVGQGDSEYIELPNGKNVLIDGGPSKNTIAAFFKEKNITKIDYVVLSHPHSDHYTGLIWAFDNLSIEHFYDSNFIGSATIQAFREKIKNTVGVTVHYPQIGEELHWGDDVSAKVYNTCVGAVIAEKNANNCSLVIKVTSNSQSILFMGDAEKPAISKMLSQWKNELGSDVLKVSHHGSSTGTTLELLNAVHPKEAYIEVGKDNNYGHPTTTVLDLLQSSGAKIFRTDVESTQIVNFD